MPATERLSDERITELRRYAGNGCSSNLPEWRRGTVKRDVVAALDELRAYRAGEIAPEGKVIVDEDDQRLLIETAVRNCPECTFSVEHNYGPQATCDGDLTRGQCRAALLAHFGLAEAQDPAHERPGEEGQR